MASDRALSWDEWRAAVFEVTFDRVVALVEEVEAAEIHPLAASSLRWKLCDLKEAVAMGDLVAFEKIEDDIRWKLAHELAWERRKEATCG